MEQVGVGASCSGMPTGRLQASGFKPGSFWQGVKHTSTISFCLISYNQIQICTYYIKNTYHWPGPKSMAKQIMYRLYNHKFNTL